MAAYQNAYRQDLNKEDDEETTTTSQEDPNKATPPENTDTLSAEEKTFKGRYDALKTHYDSTVVAQRNTIAQLQSQLSKSSAIPFPKSPEEIQTWKQEFPDVYAIVKTIARMEATEERKDIDLKLETIAVSARQAKRDKAEAILLRYHPDFDQLRADPEFHAWAKTQPRPIQDWLYENEDDPLLAAKAVDLYKAEKGVVKKTANKRQDQIDASKVVTRTPPSIPDKTEDGKKVWKASEVRKLTPRQFERAEEEIDLAIREGRWVQDEK